MEWVIENYQTIISVITGLCTIASAVCAATPTPKDDAIFNKIYKILEMFALNVGKAKQ